MHRTVHERQDCQAFDPRRRAIKQVSWGHARPLTTIERRCGQLCRRRARIRAGPQLLLKAEALAAILSSQALLLFRSG